MTNSDTVDFSQANIEVSRDLSWLKGLRGSSNVELKAFLPH